MVYQGVINWQRQSTRNTLQITIRKPTVHNRVDGSINVGFNAYLSQPNTTLAKRDSPEVLVGLNMGIPQVRFSHIVPLP